MKITANLLRQLIKEELLHVPEFVIRDIASECVQKLKVQMDRHIQVTSQSADETHDMKKHAEKLLSELETNIFEQLYECTQKFTNKSYEQKEKMH